MSVEERGVTKEQGPGLPARLIQMVPRFRPDADGLGEFSLCLADALWRKSSVPSDFVVWRQSRSKPELALPEGRDFPHRIFRAEQSNRKAFAAALAKAAKGIERPVLLLHYTSYAFSKEGIAWWLPPLLRRFIANGGRVVGFFHELYAVGRFPNKTWFSSGLQRHVFREILASCSAALSSTPLYMDQMAQENREGRPLVLAGISSNVGEAAAMPPPSAREPRLVVFGQHFSRSRLYEQNLPLLARIAAHLRIKEVADIGAPGVLPALLDKARESFASFGARLAVYGALPAEEVGAIFSTSLAGAVSYPNGMHLKSGIVGGYQAYGLPVILFRYAGEQESPELKPVCLSPHQLLVCDAGSAELADTLHAAGRAGFDFYRSHRSYDAVLEQVLPWLVRH